ncbi:MAG: hypothetical protein JJV93_02475 [Alphaproteobacteria bacterium]|nr:hypothetical protein [Alphaproteobacteria bacterium]MBL0718097.1 hypothetical protein [Alphaproteobacteria bacterium]
MVLTKALQLRRGTDESHNGFTGLEGEITMNTTTNTAHIHDGETATGHSLARADLENISDTVLTNKIFSTTTKEHFTADFFTTRGLLKTDMSNIDIDSAINNLQVARVDLSNVSSEDITASNIAKKDLSNISNEDFSNIGLVKNDLLSTTDTAGLIKLATENDFPTSNNTAITPSLLNDLYPTSIKSLPLNYIRGLISSINEDEEIIITSGYSRDDGDNINIKLPSSIMKLGLKTFSIGHGGGVLSIDPATIEDNTTIHLFIVSNQDCTKIDIIADTSLTGDNISTNQTIIDNNLLYKRRISSCLLITATEYLKYTGSELSGGGIGYFLSKPSIILYSTNYSDIVNGLDMYCSIPEGITTKIYIDIYYVTPSNNNYIILYKNHYNQQEGTLLYNYCSSSSSNSKSLVIISNTQKILYISTHYINGSSLYYHFNVSTAYFEDARV